jgi:hypothetical protein
MEHGMALVDVEKGLGIFKDELTAGVPAKNEKPALF